MPRFSVIIVNYNGGAYPQGALNSLKRQTIRDFDVLFVDNASSDGSGEGLDTAGLPAFTALPQDSNLGFAAANNLAARVAQGSWLVLLNPDAEAAPDWLERIDAAITAFPNVAMFASTQYDLHDPERLDGAGDAYHVFGFPWRGGFGRPARERPGLGECFSPCGAGAVIRRETFLAHGGFDERFFCYCEDVDLGYRFRLAGERCLFLPDAVIDHAGGGLSGQNSDFSVYHGTRNRVWTYWKNTPAPLLVLTLPGHIVLSLYVLARSALISRFTATLRGLRDGVGGAAAVRRPSAFGPPERTVSLWQLLRAMAWNPWRMSARRVHVRALNQFNRAPTATPQSSADVSER